MRDSQQLKYGRGALSNHRIMEIIVKRDRCGWKCHYCRTKLLHIRNKRRSEHEFCYWDTIENQNEALWPTLDHRRPKARFGKDDIRNLVLACRDCNGRKGSRYTYKEFMKLIHDERKNAKDNPCRGRKN